MVKKLSLREMFQGRISSLGIREILPNSGYDEHLTAVNIRLFRRIPSALLKGTNPSIAVFSPQAVTLLLTGEKIHCRRLFDGFSSRNIVFLFLAQSLSIPLPIKKIADGKISVAATEYEEYHLKNILQALIREKFQETVLLHGVALEIQGNGLLITGPSGIGKTTASLKMMGTPGCSWVADDVIVIKKNTRGDLIAGGHKKIRKYIHTSATGIISAASLFKPGGIKSNTKLAAVIETARIVKKEKQMSLKMKKILGKNLPCLSINIPSSGYFGKNLLKKAVKLLFQDK